jgi:hypothetical protein
VRDYFGVEIGLYFAFLQSLAEWMLHAGIVGLAPMGGFLLYGTLDNGFASLYSGISLLWWFWFTKKWKQRTRHLAYYWHASEEAEANSGTRFSFESHSGAPRGRQLRQRRQGFYSKEDFYIPLQDDMKPGQETAETEGRFDREKRRGLKIISWLLIAIFVLLSFSVRPPNAKKKRPSPPRNQDHAYTPHPNSQLCSAGPFLDQSP